MKEKERKPIKNVMGNNLWMMKQIWRYTPGYVIWMVIEGVAWGINHSINIIYIEQLFDALGARSGFESVARVILVYAVYTLLFQVFHQWYWSFYNQKVKEKLHIAMHSDMFRQAVQLDLAKYDDPVFYNDFIWAMEKAFTHAAGLMEDTGKLLNRLVASLTITGVIVTVDGQMAVFILVMCAASVMISLWNNRTNVKYHMILNPIERKEGYIKRVFMLPDYAKELRISRVTEPLFEEFCRNAEDHKEVTARYGKKLAWLNFLYGAIRSVGEIGLIIFMLYKVMLTGEIGLGGFAAGVYASWRLSWLLQDLVDRLLKYHEHGIFIEKMITFLNCRSSMEDGSAKAPSFESLVIRDLSFGYGKEQKDRAMDGVSMEIRRGEKIAIVGYNGAGKTTLTKLILRLYDPNEGQILYNGKDIRTYTMSSLRKRMAVVFQDYRIFAASLAENVAGGEYTDAEEGKVKEALRKSTFTERLNSLKKGLDTPLTKEFEREGTSLSGGEQQKVAIARAFYQDADLIILDEPSSALDPDAEYELNRAITSYTDNKTVIFISHRLSTTRHADRIYMFDGGKLIEKGTHEQLMEYDGKYAQMFKVQAKRYQEDAEV